MVESKELFYGTIIKCEGIIEAILEHTKADQNALLHKMHFFTIMKLFFQPPRLCF